MRCLTMALMLMLVMGLGFVGCSTPEATSEKETGSETVPSGPLSLIVVDVAGLRVDHLGSYGMDGATSPEMDALASEAVRFEWAFAQAPCTAPAVASLLTGIYASSLQMGEGEENLATEAQTLPELLGGEDVVAAAFMDGRTIRCDLGLGQGFSLCDDSGVGASEVGGKALSWFQENAGKRRVLWVHLEDPKHYSSGQESAQADGGEAPVDSQVRETAYSEAILSVDSWIGELRGASVDLDNTILAVLGSHGLDFGEGGVRAGGALAASVTRVPLFLRMPDGEHRGEVVSKIVETLDLVPTLLELSGVEVPEGMQGASLLPLMKGKGNPPYIAFGESSDGGGERYAALGGYRLVLNKETRTTELYHTAQDPQELIDLAESESNRVEVLMDHLEAWEALVDATQFGAPPAAESLDEAELEKLRTLGYIQ